MKISEVLPKESISEVYFRYPSKMEGYPNLSSYIPKLYEIRKPAFGKGDRKFYDVVAFV